MGLNLSTLDGWWEEAYRPELGWAIGDSRHDDPDEQDRFDVDELYTLLEREVAPAFYDRDASGVPRAWVRRMRRSMVDLTLQFSASRMVRDYLDKAYLPAARALHERVSDDAAAAKAMAAWDRHLRRDWPNVHIGESDFVLRDDGRDISVPIYLGEIAAEDVRVEIYAEATAQAASEVVILSNDGPIPGATSGYLFGGRVIGARPSSDYTVRIVPSHPGVRVPAEMPLIHWQR
jgi:starch phosphorylase